MTPISVAMATYNGARFLREQLDSIAAQTVLPAELVVTDDGSTDDTIAVVRAFARTAPFPVHVHENPVRLGFRANFMHAIGLCTSELIALCDQDDVWEAHKLERVSAPFTDPEVLLCYHEAWLIDSAGERLGLAHIYPLLDRNPPSSTNPMLNPYGFAMMVRRRLLDFSEFWESSVDNLQLQHKMAHDQWLFFLASAFGTVAYVDEPLAGYRQHDNNTYGFAGPARNWRGKVANWVNIRAKDFASLTVAAKARASILARASDRLDETWQQRARVAIARYETFATHAQLRASIYDSPSIIGRLNAWRALHRDGAYANDTRWTFGRKAALVDLGCLIAPKSLLGAVSASGSGKTTEAPVATKS